MSPDFMPKETINKHTNKSSTKLIYLNFSDPHEHFIYSSDMTNGIIQRYKLRNIMQNIRKITNQLDLYYSKPLIKYLFLIFFILGTMAKIFQITIIQILFSFYVRGFFLALILCLVYIRIKSCSEDKKIQKYLREVNKEYKNKDVELLREGNNLLLHLDYKTQFSTEDKTVLSFIKDSKTLDYTCKDLNKRVLAEMDLTEEQVYQSINEMKMTFNQLKMIITKRLMTYCYGTLITLGILVVCCQVMIDENNSLADYLYNVPQVSFLLWVIFSLYNILFDKKLSVGEKFIKIMNERNADYMYQNGTKWHMRIINQQMNIPFYELFVDEFNVIFELWLVYKYEQEQQI